jgi:hypothetical protein
MRLKKRSLAMLGICALVMTLFGVNSSSANAIPTGPPKLTAVFCGNGPNNIVKPGQYISLEYLINASEPLKSVRFSARTKVLNGKVGLYEFGDIGDIPQGTSHAPREFKVPTLRVKKGTAVTVEAALFASGAKAPFAKAVCTWDGYDVYFIYK